MVWLQFLLGLHYFISAKEQLVFKVGPSFCRCGTCTQPYLPLNLKTLLPSECVRTNTFTFTFFGEKFLGIFSRHNELARHLPQKFYDQCNVICMFQTFQEGEKKTYMTGVTNTVAAIAERAACTPLRKASGLLSALSGKKTRSSCWRVRGTIKSRRPGRGPSAAE